MNAEQWIQFWEIVIAVAVGGFAVLALVVTVGGMRDVQEMFRRMAEQDTTE